MPESNTPVKGKIKFAQITSSDCALTKTFSSVNGELVSSAIAHMTEGRATVCEIDSVSDLKGALELLAKNQAITCGIPYAGDTALTTRAGAEFRPDAVARTNEAFHWPSGPALFTFDIDVDEKHAPFTSVRAALEALEACHPWLTHVLRVARPSSSSFVGKRGLRGVHIYIGVTSGLDIPALEKRVQLEQWSKGKGWIKISKSGALLVRQLSDSLVYQPSRLMFEATPICEGDIERIVPDDQAFIIEPPTAYAQGRPPAARTADGFLDVKSLPVIREIEFRRFDAAKGQKRDAHRTQAKAIALNYQKEQAIANGLDATEGERLGLIAIRALGDKKLPTTWTLALKGEGDQAERVTVGEILANPAQYLARQCADPFDTWRPDLEPRHFDKAQIFEKAQEGVWGVWSHKLQAFFEFTTDAAANIASPIERAAEKFAGCIEYPEPVGKKNAPAVNIAHALRLLLSEIGSMPRLNVCLGVTEKDSQMTALSLQNALSRVGSKGVTTAAIKTALDDIAEENQFDPWRDAVLALPAWDKSERLSNLFIDNAGAEDCAAVRLSTQLFFAAVCMRQMHPGIAYQAMPVLISTEQEWGKSHMPKAVAQALDAPPPPAINFCAPIEMSRQARAGLTVEVAEMSGLRKSDREAVKTWLTDDTDVYRDLFEKQATPHPRRFVQVGTSNHDEMYHDETGERRLMPVVFTRSMRSYDWAANTRQILAEAKEKFCQSTDAYLALHGQAVAAVKAYNAVRMSRGVGLAESPLDDYLPAVFKALRTPRSDDTWRVDLLNAANALAKQPGAGKVTSKQLARTARQRQWKVGKSGVRYIELSGAQMAALVEDDEGEHVSRNAEQARAAFELAAGAVTHAMH
ncbi:virulence-associated E family protein [Caballeronia novacaledonica]|uniref:Virulence protein E n=1 Tax=Caballeronia novacaledonica TaxID=1544861 RepID=A0AA37IGD5_9BURK|nr:virulence-associated E family protein [Caballeronia novacaledonica]GJH28158.1 virulence protein E [Caballeronia novacaledonica]